MTNPLGWRDQAACAAPVVDPEVMYPESMTGARTSEARRICRACPVKADCLTHALETDQREGIWGGLTPKERARFRAGDGTHLDPDGRLRKPCGTDRAFRVHKTYGETCDVCQRAHDARVLAQRLRLLDEAHATGGSVAGGAVHRRLGEPVCALCRAAQARDSAVRRARRASRNSVAAEPNCEPRTLHVSTSAGAAA